MNFEKTLKNTLHWYANYYEGNNVKKITSDQILNYLEL